MVILESFQVPYRAKFHIYHMIASAPIIGISQSQLISEDYHRLIECSLALYLYELYSYYGGKKLHPTTTV